MARHSRRSILGEITKWDDEAIKKLNPNAKLPSQAIAVVYRSDGSGTTFVWTDYLSKASADLKAKVGSNTSVQFPAGIGAKGNEGVANNVMQTKGAIGYVEYAYAKQNKLAYSRMINKDGKTVSPVMESFQAAAANADWSAPGIGVILTEQAVAHLADHQPDLHLDAQEGGRMPSPPKRSSSSIGLTQRRHDGRRPRLRAAAGCGGAKIEKSWAGIIGDDSKPLFVKK